MLRKAALIILDGVGISPENDGNALYLAKTPYFDELIKAHPKCLLSASGAEVGLQWGEFGNSEVGHTNIGLGRVVLQDLPQINNAFATGKITEKDGFRDLVKTLESSTSKTVHIIGMASDGAVHGHIDHILQTIKQVQKAAGRINIVVHLISDGRDVAEKSIDKFAPKIAEIVKSGATIGSISGRYFAMDRDKNWDRIQLAMDAILGAGKIKAPSLEEAINNAYKRNETDEYFSPTTIGSFSVNQDQDVFIFTNYRADRAIQLTRAFIEEDSSEVSKKSPVRHFYMMTTYDDNLPAKSIFTNLDLNDATENPLAHSATEIISGAGLSQFHVAETEKFAHVTYFFSGGIKEEFENQTNKIIPSEKVKSYDLFPQMRAREIADEIINASKNFDFIVANFANGDMVGHSGKLDAAVKAVEVVDSQLARAIPKLIDENFNVFVTADHGNCDEMIDSLSKKPSKEHSFNPVPFIQISKENKGNYESIEYLRNTQAVGVLADIIPTILIEMGLQITPEMMGLSLTKSLI